MSKREFHQVETLVMAVPRKLKLVPTARLVEEAVVEKKLVEVAEVVVELPVIKRLESMVDEAVERKPWSKPKVVEVETPQEVGVQAKTEPEPLESVPQITLPVESVSRVSQRPRERKRLVVEAVVENRLVEVALVEVEFEAVKFWRVVEPMTRRSPEVLMVVVAVPPILKEFAVKRLAKELVEVAEVVVLWLAMKPPVKVEEAVERKPCKKPRVVEVELP